ncbi:hypothetical protein Tco_0051396 [Tanacetum coccineum]
MVVQNQSQLGEGSTIPTDPHHTPTFIQPSTQPQKTQQPRKPKRKDTQVPQPSDPIENVADEAVHKELGDSLVRAATTASSLEAEQDSEVFATTVDDITLAQVLEETKSIKPKKKGVVIQELGEIYQHNIFTLSSQQSQDKEFYKLNFDEEERLAREKAEKEEEEANISLIETRDDIQAKIDVDH